MHDDFYSTVAQVLPVFLLALLWESPHLQRLAEQSRPPRSAETPTGWFWTKARVRRFTLAVSVSVMLTFFADILVLSGAVTDLTWVRAVIVVALVVVGGALLFRMWVDVAVATRE